MPALLGGTRILAATWFAPTGLQVRFSSTYGALRFHQLYAGRTMIGVTNAPTERTVRGTLKHSDWPQPLQLVAVLPDERLDDFGSTLPPRPYNRVQLGWTTSGWTDAKKIEITAGTEPGGAVDPANVLTNLPFDTNRNFAYRTKPLPGTGEWNFEVAGIDVAGNRGTGLSISAEIIAHPPDVALNPDGSRLTAAVAAGELTVSFTYPDW